jgi:sulfite exporter TauE/SafE
MCGAFLAMAVGPGERASSTAMLQSAYHGGRLVTYSVLGAVSGSIGAALDLAGRGAGIARVAALVAGGTMVLFGVLAVLRVLGVRAGRVGVPKGWQRLVGAGHRAMMGFGPVTRAFGIGLLTTLLPCGWLYAFAITAAGTGSPVHGALVMAVFWLGTLPVLVTLGIGVTRIAGPLRRHVPLATSLVLIGVGLFTVLHRTTLPAMASDVKADASVDRVQTLDETVPPCCQSKAHAAEGSP